MLAWYQVGHCTDHTNCVWPNFVGFQDVDDGEAADLCSGNTCTVTNEGDSKSRQVIRRLARDNPDSRIVVMGCYAPRAPDELSDLPNVSEVVTEAQGLGRVPKGRRVPNADGAKEDGVNEAHVE